MQAMSSSLQVPVLLAVSREKRVWTAVPVQQMHLHHRQDVPVAQPCQTMQINLFRKICFAE